MNNNATDGEESEGYHETDSVAWKQTLHLNVPVALSLAMPADVPAGKHNPGQQTHLRNVAHIAASQLQNKGYTVIKAVTRSWPYDLIAFNHQNILLIATRRHTKQQTAKQILQIYQDLISDMQYIPAPTCAEKQIWIYQNGYGFSVYKLFQGGIMRKEWE